MQINTKYVGNQKTAKHMPAWLFGVLLQFLRQHAGKESVIHFQHAVGAAGDRHIMGDHDQRLAEFLLRAQEQGKYLLGVGTVQIAGRLVSKQDLRAVDQRTGNRNTLLLAAGKLVGLVAQAILDAQRIDDLFERFFLRKRRLAAHHGRNKNVFQRC